jgi:hypothetical protein
VAAGGGHTALWLARWAWESLELNSGLEMLHSELQPMKQPELEWYFNGAGTSLPNREFVWAPSPWPRLTLLARRPGQLPRRETGMTSNRDDSDSAAGVGTPGWAGRSVGLRGSSALIICLRKARFWSSK